MQDVDLLFIRETRIIDGYRENTIWRHGDGKKGSVRVDDDALYDELLYVYNEYRRLRREEIAHLEQFGSLSKVENTK